MKTAQINNYGHVDEIKIIDIEKPKAGKGQVLVKVYASCVNPVDTKIREGLFKPPSLKFPFVLGSDFAGVITEIGEGVENFSVGNKVYGSGSALAGATGAFAEFVAVPAGIISKMPNNVDFNQAAAIVLVGVSAVQAILEHSQLKSGQKILIHGGAGGIGTAAIQIAKSIGAYVATTASGDGIDFVKKLGADKVIDYKTEKFEELLSDFDVVYDTVGGEVFEKSFKVLKKGGIIVSMVAQDEKKLSEQYGVKVISQFTQVNTNRLDALRDLIENGEVKVHVDKVFLFDNIKEAFSAKETGEVLGKIAIQVNK